MGIPAETESPVTALRAVTRPAHQRIEAHPLVRSLVSGRGLSRAGYGRLLQTFHAWYAAVEAKGLAARAQQIAADHESC